MAPDAAGFWDSLHEQARFRPSYPSEHVVRFLARRACVHLPWRQRALDIGVGGGRHTILLAKFGYAVDGVDISAEGIRQTQNVLAEDGVSAELRQASMGLLPFAPDTFDVVLSVGVFYYGTAAEGQAAIDEVRRVLKPNGEALVVMRTARDVRRGRGEALGDEAYRLLTHDTNEYGTIQHFLTEQAVRDAFAGFSELQFELTETTFANRTARNSDWLISVRK
ncbi:MAG: class I SAM-dependent methyltransferase [Solirubrobacteraceae bacterium]